MKRKPIMHLQLATDSDHEGMITCQANMGRLPLVNALDLTNVTLSVDKKYSFHFSRLVNN
jgi:hypothetical protein